MQEQLEAQREAHHQQLSKLRDEVDEKMKEIEQLKEWVHVLITLLIWIVLILLMLCCQEYSVQQGWAAYRPRGVAFGPRPLINFLESSGWKLLSFLVELLKLPSWKGSTPCALHCVLIQLSKFAPPAQMAAQPYFEHYHHLMRSILQVLKSDAQVPLRQ